MIGKSIIAAGSGKGGIEIRMRWDAANKQLGPLERHAADENLIDLPRDKTGEETYIHHINATEMVGATEPATLPGSKRDTRPPCCTNCNRTEGHELLISGQLHLATSQLPIHALIDTGNMQINVVSARRAAAARGNRHAYEWGRREIIW